uniref:Uncharacterized protein n=1 Tax=Meloidogyne enterolobii TaxID=390850 RepID=A0A6V7WHF5_MELEN|nr:unnamed protein product [Meloidogyne enterolobii]
MTFQYLTVQLGGRIVRINQLTGETNVIKDVRILNINQDIWDGKLPEFDLQIFRKATISNFTDQHLDLLELMHAFRAARLTDSRPLEDRQVLLKAYRNPSFPSITNWFKQLDWLKIWTTIVTLILTLKWILSWYYYFQIKLIRKILVRNNPPHPNNINLPILKDIEKTDGKLLKNDGRISNVGERDEEREW